MLKSWNPMRLKLFQNSIYEVVHINKVLLLYGHHDSLVTKNLAN